MPERIVDSEVLGEIRWDARKHLMRPEIPRLELVMEKSEDVEEQVLRLILNWTEAPHA